MLAYFWELVPYLITAVCLGSALWYMYRVLNGNYFDSFSDKKLYQTLTEIDNDHHTCTCWWSKGSRDCLVCSAKLEASRKEIVAELLRRHPQPDCYGAVQPDPDMVTHGLHPTYWSG